MVDGLFKDLTQEGYYIKGYADDIALLVSGKFPDTVSDMINHGLIPAGGTLCQSSENSCCSIYKQEGSTGPEES